MTSIPPDFSPDPREVAMLKVKGQEFTDWESVYVQVAWTEEVGAMFKFTMAERDDPPPSDWTKLQFGPSDSVDIVLAGQPAISGFITIRQVQYEAQGHTVILTGRGQAYWAVKSSVLTEEANIDGMNIVQVGKKWIEKYGVHVGVIGEPDMEPFKEEQANPGEPIFSAMSRLAVKRNSVIGTNEKGDFLIIGPHDPEMMDVLKEGQNILRAQGVISVENMWMRYWVVGQGKSDNEHRAPDAHEIKALAQGKINRPSDLESPAGPLKDDAEGKKVANYYRDWNDGTIIEAIITVQGWLSPKGTLWRAGQDVFLDSPMLMIQRMMKIQTVVYTQSVESGTLTTLTCVLPWKLKSRGSIIREGTEDKFTIPPNSDTVFGGNQIPPSPPPEEPPFRG